MLGDLNAGVGDKINCPLKKNGRTPYPLAHGSSNSNAISKILR
jgi:hypothetical protein